MDGKQIREITAERLTYLTDDGTEAFIDFAMCYANYFRKMTSSDYIDTHKKLNPRDHWDDKDIKAYFRKVLAWREVARRNILSKPWGDGPYIEFHTEPPTRFDFASEDDFRKVRYEIEQFGWQTFDLS